MKKLIIIILASLLSFVGCGLRIKGVKTSYYVEEQGKECLFVKEVVFIERENK